MCNWHVPVCVSCRINLRPKKNGVTFIEDDGIGNPYAIWDSDMWDCPCCGISVLTGFGKEPWRLHFDSDFHQVVEKEMNSEWTIRERPKQERKVENEP